MSEMKALREISWWQDESRLCLQP